MPSFEFDLTHLDRFAAGFPHEVFASLRREAPVWFHPPTAHTPGGEGFWVLSRYGDIVAAAADENHIFLGNRRRSRWRWDPHRGPSPRFRRRRAAQHGRGVTSTPVCVTCRCAFRCGANLSEGVSESSRASSPEGPAARRCAVRAADCQPREYRGRQCRRPSRRARRVP